MAKKSTLSDVARAAGVSVFTVSQAVNGRDGLAESTRDRVLRVADELGYIPNRSAQLLRRSDRSQIAVVTGDSSNVYYVDLLRGISRAIREHERTVLTMDIAAEGVYSVETEDAVVRELIRMRVSGVITTLVLRSESLALFQQYDVPVVFVDSRPDQLTEHMGFFGTDNVSVGREVGHYLADQGLRRWLFVAYPSTWSSRAPRERGLREAALEVGAQIDVIESRNDPAAATTVLREYLESKNGARLPDVVVAANNPILQGTLVALSELHLSIPKDVGVLAYDEFPWARLMVPPMTVVDEHAETIGDVAARCLMRVMDRQTKAEKKGRSARPIFDKNDHLMIPATIVSRESCGERTRGRHSKVSPGKELLIE